MNETNAARRRRANGGTIEDLVGIVMGITRARKDGKLLLVAGLIVNVVPPILMAGFFLWLFFGFKM